MTRDPGGSIVSRMDRTAAIAELPEAYATALRLRDEDVNDETIAVRLGIEVEAVEPLLRLAAAKLDHFLAANDPVQEGTRRNESVARDVTEPDARHRFVCLPNRSRCAQH